MADLHQKLNKAQASIVSTRPIVPALLEKEPSKVLKIRSISVLFISYYHTTEGREEETRGESPHKECSGQVRDAQAYITTPFADKSAHSTRIAIEAQHGLIAQVLKDIVFSTQPKVSPDTEAISDVVDTSMAIG